MLNRADLCNQQSIEERMECDFLRLGLKKYCSFNLDLSWTLTQGEATSMLRGHSSSPLKGSFGEDLLPTASNNLFKHVSEPPSKWILQPQWSKPSDDCTFATLANILTVTSRNPDLEHLAHRNCEIINVYCFKTLSLGVILNVAIG